MEDKKANPFIRTTFTCLVFVSSEKRELNLCIPCYTSRVRWWWPAPAATKRDDATELTKELCCGVVGGRKWESRLLLLGLVGWMGWALKDVDELLW